MANDRPIVVLGSANVDFIMRLDRLPQIGETVTGGEFVQTYGGKGANQAVAAARAGGRVVFLGSLGDDAHGRAIAENLRADGIETRPTVFHPDTPTGSALVMFDRHGDNYLAVAPRANYALRRAHLEERRDWIAGAALLVLQMEIPAEATEEALAQASAAGVPVLFNFAPARLGDIAVDARMTGLVVNEVEAESLCGFPVAGPEEARAAGDALRAMGPQWVVLTLGARGGWVTSADWTGAVPPFPVAPVDSTAAGDVFCGALAVALTEGRTLADAARFASASAALSVTRAGAQPSIPRRDEIEQLNDPPRTRS